MFFTASKLLSLFIKPLFIISFLLLASLIAKNKNYKKWFLGLATFLLLFFGNAFIENEVCHAWEYQPKLIKELGSYDVAIVLSGITESRYPPRDRVYVRWGADRILHTIQLYRLGKVKKILITGGSGLLGGTWTSEAEEMKRVFLLANIPDAAIILETHAKNTRENAALTKETLDKLNIHGSLLLVTSALHMRRSKACFDKAGLNTQPFPVDFFSHQREFNLLSFFIPSEEALSLWTAIIHEFVGYLTYKIMGYC